MTLIHVASLQPEGDWMETWVQSYVTAHYTWTQGEPTLSQTTLLLPWLTMDLAQLNSRKTTILIRLATVFDVSRECLRTDGHDGAIWTRHCKQLNKPFYVKSKHIHTPSSQETLPASEHAVSLYIIGEKVSRRIESRV